MSKVEIAVADVTTTGISPGTYPIEFLRQRLDELGAVPIGRLDQVPDRSRVLVGGAITHRQRPATAGGVTFITSKTKPECSTSSSPQAAGNDSRPSPGNPRRFWSAACWNAPTASPASSPNTSNNSR